MKKIYLVFIIIISFMPVVLAAEDPYKTITFTVDPFVRVGFASVPENTLAAPQTKLGGLPLEGENNIQDGIKLRTGIGYLYCQVFTNSNISLNFSSIERGDSTKINNTFDWTAYFSPLYGNTIEGTFTTASSDKTPLIQESLSSNELNFPRVYWWEFYVELNEDYEMPESVATGNLIVEVSTNE